VVITYGVSRLDLDVEDRSLGDAAGIDRRDRAVHQVEQWAAARGRPVQFVYTVPAQLAGPGPDEVAMLRNAELERAQISIVNFMTFDYGVRGRQDMAADTEVAATNLYSFLRQLHPAISPDRAWQMVGVTEMIGVDDSGPAQALSVADARTVLHWAERSGIGELSFWALQRDNGRCPGRKHAQGDCSGVAQTPWQYSKALERFT
jgi:chitinase